MELKVLCWEEELAGKAETRFSWMKNTRSGPAGLMKQKNTMTFACGWVPLKMKECLVLHFRASLKNSTFPKEELNSMASGYTLNKEEEGSP